MAVPPYTSDFYIFLLKLRTQKTSFRVSNCYIHKKNYLNTSVLDFATRDLSTATCEAKRARIFSLNIAINYSSKSSSSKFEFYYPLIPVAATPSTKYFCKHRNTINTGINDITEAAMINPYSDEYCPINIRKPICNVFLLSVVR